MRKLVLFVLCMAMIGSQLFAQTRSLTGRITDEAGNPLVGATVSVVGATRTSTTTNASGVYTLTVPANARELEVTYVGFTTRRIAIEAGTTQNVSLTAATGSLGDVVVTGYTREKKTQFAGAATAISAKAVELVPVGSFDQALQGRAPGMLVNSGSGQPGSSPNIIIRGVQSIQGAGAQPLYILDGVPIPAGDFQTINPNDFESITVLKDAAAAALYGARGGTGVIVITTKKGRAGQTNFTFRSQLGFTQAPNLNNFDLMNTNEILQYEEQLGLSGAPTNTPGWTYSKRNPAYANLPATSPANNPWAASQARYDAMLDSIRRIDMDWQKIFFRRGISQTHELNMSGGTERTRFFISAGVFDQQGTDLKSALKRYTTRINLDHTANKLNVQWNTTAGYSKTTLSEGEWQGNSPRNSFQMAFRAKPYENPFKPDGTYNWGANTTLALRQVGNLLEGIENTTWDLNQIKINSGLTVNYKLFPTVTLMNRLGVDVRSEYHQRFVNPNSYIGTLQQFADTATLAGGTNAEAYRLITQLINTTGAIYNERFGTRHEVEVGAYFEGVRGYQKGMGFQMFRLDPRLPGTGQGAAALPVGTAQTFPQYASSASSGFGIRSYFATGRYSLDNKYSFNFNLRQDGTSRIANEENREIFTWSAGFVWNAMQEQFMKNQNIFSDLRFRASYGIVPNIGSITVGSYGIPGSLLSVTNFQGPQLPQFGATTYAGSTVGGLVPSTPGNPNLKIENIRKTNIGLDFSMWRNRARFNVDVYKNKTVDLFVNQPLAATTGFGNTSTPINAGTMTNRGIELQVSVDVVKTRNFDLTLGGNHSINVNRIEDLGLVNEYQLGTFIIRPGLPYGSHYTYDYQGADPATGRPTYKTLDGGITTDLARAGRFAHFGTYLPKHIGGFTADVRYKAFTISALFSYQTGSIRSNNTENWITRGTAGYHASVNAARRMLTDQWRQPGDVAKYQNPLYDRDFTSDVLQDASFLRFRNLNIGYQIPAIGPAARRYIKSARVYMQMQNVFIWSPWRGPDPEDNNNISLNEFPNPRMTVFGIDINF
ncbi:SusC/RagA family TonB-linked outer membrane protein [Aridibaculum aurantiacum]|uniref:SusC/RagA family TonB-linked outer membrane protein n=1 Tax=Aridibaculum aurantiacum TaxID=2810307 RepID=UPI001A977057|nr:SusC/RagA family TonB-linked outer membrane protein [Aridibaculum aurantiacum]